VNKTVDPELYRVQPDTPAAPPSDEGIHSWPFGSYAPMGFYRPVPIVRFVGTILLQFVLNLVLYDLLVLAPAAVTVGACTLLALILGARAYLGWLETAATGWKIATLAALALNVLWVAFFGVVRMA